MKRRSPLSEEPAEIERARLCALLDRRDEQLASARARIPGEVALRRAAQSALKECERTSKARLKELRSKLARSERINGECVRGSRAAETRLRRLARQVLNTQEEERKRISRDLHDAIGQTLTGINVGLATLKSESAAGSRTLAEAASMTQRLVERSMKTVHQFAWALRPTLLDDLGIVSALRSYAKTFAQRTGVEVRFAADANLGRLDPDCGTALFRVAQDALSNVERHARAGRVTLTLRARPGAVRLLVKDDGRSFDVDRMNRSKTNEHLGLLVMRERTEMVGGTFVIESSPGRGTSVRADIPLKVVTHA